MYNFQQIYQVTNRPRYKPIRGTHRLTRQQICSHTNRYSLENHPYYIDGGGIKSLTAFVNIPSYFDIIVKSVMVSSFLGLKPLNGYKIHKKYLVVQIMCSPNTKSKTYFKYLVKQINMIS